MCCLVVQGSGGTMNHMDAAEKWDSQFVSGTSKQHARLMQAQHARLMQAQHAWLMQAQHARLMQAQHDSATVPHGALSHL